MSFEDISLLGDYSFTKKVLNKLSELRLEGKVILKCLFKGQHDSRSRSCPPHGPLNDKLLAQIHRRDLVLPVTLLLS